MATESEAKGEFGEVMHDLKKSLNETPVDITSVRYRKALSLSKTLCMPMRWSKRYSYDIRHPFLGSMPSLQSWFSRGATPALKLIHQNVAWMDYLDLPGVPIFISRIHAFHRYLQLLGAKCPKI